MKPREFSAASFAVNRWSVGHQGAPADAMRDGLQADVDAGKRRGEIFRENRQRAKLRGKLLAENPHCDNCGCQLIADSSSPFYAQVVVDRISCKKCVRIVRALRELETDGDPTVLHRTATERMDAAGLCRRQTAILLTTEERQLLELGAALQHQSMPDFVLQCLRPHFDALRKKRLDTVESEVTPC